MFKLLIHFKHRNFQRLWVAQLISQFGDRINQMALVGFVAERAFGDAAQLAKLIAFTIIPVFLLQPFAGVFVDRWNRRRTLFVCDILRGGLVLLIPFFFFRGDSMLPVYAIVFCMFCFSRFYQPAKMSMVPELVEDDNLLMANSLISTTGMIAFVLGCATGGFLIDRLGSRTGFIIDGATFFVSAALIFSMSLPRILKKEADKILHQDVKAVAPITKSVWAEIKEGFAYLWTNKEIQFVINMIFVLFSAAGAIYVVVIIFIQQSFGTVTRDLGILAVCLGAGLFTGAIGYGKWGQRFVWYKTMFFCLIAGGLMLASFALAVHFHPNLFTAMVLAALMGLIVGPIFIAANTIIHVVSDEAMRGKVFSALEIVIHAAFLAAMLLSAWLAKAIDPVWILTGVGVLFAGVGGIGIIRRVQFQALTET